MDDMTKEEAHQFLENLKQAKIRFCEEWGLPIPAFDKEEDYFPPSTPHPVEYIREHVPLAERLAELAEEAAELSQAALKYRRAIDGTNPTPIDPETALEEMLEEFGDVDNCREVIITATQQAHIVEKRQPKQKRWMERVREVMKAKCLSSPQ